MVLVDQRARMTGNVADRRDGYAVGVSQAVEAAADEDAVNGRRRSAEQRAQAVMAAVLKGGVAASRVSAVGWGQEKPIADNRGEEGRAKNRRVEIVKK